MFFRSLSEKNNVYFIATNEMNTMPRNDFRSLTLPEGLYLELEKFVAQSNGYYVSISEVVREALRDYLKKQSE